MVKRTNCKPVLACGPSTPNSTDGHLTVPGRSPLKAEEKPGIFSRNLPAPWFYHKEQALPQAVRAQTQSWDLGFPPAGCAEPGFSSFEK